MPRSIRFTVRLTETESREMKDWATRKHMIPSVAVRRLIAEGVGPETRERGGTHHEQIRQ